MREVFVTYTDILCPLGASTEENFTAITAGTSSLRPAGNHGYVSAFSPEQQEKYWGRTFSTDFPGASAMLVSVLQKAVQNGFRPDDPKTLLVICSTKGDIDILSERSPDPLLSLSRSVAAHFPLAHTPVIISNACISGIHGLIHAQRLIAAGIYDRVIVAGTDTAGDFVQEGFSSLMALAPEPCRPFDKERKGISLGEAAVVIVLEIQPGNIKIAGGAISNDANHITGPSRDGSGLAKAIRETLGQQQLPQENVFISAHGTGTLYNDEMEALALAQCGLSALPTFSLKGYVGHTLGAAGLLETAIGIRALEQNLLPASAGYQDHGVSVPLNITRRNIQGEFTQFLKTGSGFGGCNAALLVQKTNA